MVVVREALSSPSVKVGSLREELEKSGLSDTVPGKPAT